MARHKNTTPYATLNDLRDAVIELGALRSTPTLMALRQAVRSGWIGKVSDVGERTVRLRREALPTFVDLIIQRERLYHPGNVTGGEA